MKKTLTFANLRNYISKIDRISICDYHSMSYENYSFIARVPNKYDDWIVKGIGMIESEFYKIDNKVLANGKKADRYFLPCIEIVLENPNCMDKKG